MYFSFLGLVRSCTAYLFDLVFILLLTDWRWPRKRVFALAGIFLAAVSAVNAVERVFLPWGDLPELRKPLLRLAAEVPTGWGLLSLIPGSCYVLYVSLTLLPQPLSDRTSNVPAVFLLSTMVFFVYSSLCSIFGKLRKQHQLEQEQAVTALKMESLEKQAQTFAEAQEEMKKFHHDLRHIFRIVSACIRNGDYDEAQNILSKMDADSGKLLAEKLTPSYSNDPAVNAVLSYYCETAEKNGVEIQAALDLPPDLSVDTAELSVVLANALENAVHACMQMPQDSPRKIWLTGAPARSQYLITLSNTYIGAVEFHPETGLPLAKKPGHGTGGRSILDFVERNHAQMDFSAQDGVFRLHLLL